jgi:sec-independent protein translocase protein TatA
MELKISGCVHRSCTQLFSQGGFSMFEGIFQPTHLLLIFGIALLVFGPKKLPELGKGIGAGIRALKEGIKDPLIEPGKSATAEPVVAKESNTN